MIVVPDGLTENLADCWIVLPDECNLCSQKGMHRIVPLELTDGRKVICADTIPDWNGIYAEAYALMAPFLADAEVITDIAFLIPRSDDNNE